VVRSLNKALHFHTGGCVLHGDIASRELQMIVRGSSFGRFNHHAVGMDYNAINIYPGDESSWDGC